MSDPKEGPSPPTWRLMLVKWLGLFPPLLAISYGLTLVSQQFFSPAWPLVKPDGSLILWFKLFLETLILVPLLNFVLTPWLDDLFEGFLYSDEQQAQRHGGPKDA